MFNFDKKGTVFYKKLNIVETSFTIVYYLYLCFDNLNTIVVTKAILIHKTLNFKLHHHKDTQHSNAQLLIVIMLAP